ncbi:MAG TPA: alpha/beta hydrolase [Clostridiales bacterium UBA8960]|nr:alpha/beta hydrolase [Clostridiales bacterium UBA8960]
MPIYKYGELNINYTRKGNGIPLVFLHGWGADLESFKVLTQDLEKNYEVIAIDFPGFGLSDEPPVPWSLEDYTLMTQMFIKEIGIVNPTLIGHSFGGRVSIKLSQKLELNKVILINSAGIKPSRKQSYYFRVYGYKFFRTMAALPLLKWILREPLEAYREIYSSSDYKQASAIMKQVLSKVVNEDLRHILREIKVPVLLIWGDKDTSTPIEDARLMEGLIPDAGLVVYEGAGHFSYLEHPEKTISIIKTFVGGL